MKLIKLFILSLLFINEAFACTKDALEALKTGKPSACKIDDYKKSIGKMASHNGCTIFSNTLAKVKQENHEIPSKALFDSIGYLLKNYNKVPTENLPWYRKRTEWIQEQIQKNQDIIDRSKDEERIKTARINISLYQEELKENARKLNSSKIAISNYEIGSNWNRMFSIDLSNLDDIKIDATRVAHGRGADQSRTITLTSQEGEIINPKRPKERYLNNNRTLRKCINSQKRLGPREKVNKQTMPGFYLIGRGRFNSSRGNPNKSYYNRHGVLINGWPIICPPQSRVTHQKIDGSDHYKRICNPGKGRFNELKLIGLSQSNYYAYQEGTVMHGADYNPPADSGGGSVGSSKGCPAFYEGDYQRFAREMGGTEESTSLYYSYAPQCEESQKDNGDYVKNLLKMKSAIIKDKNKIQKKIKKLLTKEEKNLFKEYLKSKNLYYKRSRVNHRESITFIRKSKGKKVIGFYEYLQHLNDFLIKNSNILNTTDPKTKALSQVMPAENPRRQALREYLAKKFQIKPYKEDERVEAYQYYCANLVDGSDQTGAPWDPMSSLQTREAYPSIIKHSGGELDLNSESEDESGAVGE